MPTYSYICKDCNEEFKVFHGIDEKQICLSCKSEDIIKQFKGTTAKIVKSSSSAKDRVEKFIEESRESLKEQLADARKEIK